MDTKKRNRREEYTRRVIRDTFLDLLRRQNVEKISVGELCELADINRSTFYRHYADVYALLDSISEEYFQMLFTNMTKTSRDESADLRNATYQMILRACAVTEDHKEIYQLLMFRQPASRFQQKLNDAYFQLLDGSHDLTHIRTPATSLHYQYMISGILGIWLAWLRDDCKVPKETVAKLAEEHMGSALHIIWTRHQQLPTP